MDIRRVLSWTLLVWGLCLVLAVLSGILWALMTWFGDYAGAPVARVLTLLFGLAAGFCQAALTALLTVRVLQSPLLPGDELASDGTDSSIPR